MHGGPANKMESCSSSERVQAGVGHQGRGYQVPVACGPDEERELEAVFIDTGDIVAYRWCPLRFGRGFKVR